MVHLLFSDCNTFFRGFLRRKPRDSAVKAALEGQHTGCAPGATCRERASMNYARVYAPGTA